MVTAEFYNQEKLPTVLIFIREEETPRLARTGDHFGSSRA